MTSAGVQYSLTFTNVPQTVQSEQEALTASLPLCIITQALIVPYKAKFALIIV
jgi:hypothetical protein